MPRNADTWIRFAVSRNALENNPIYDLKIEDFERIKSISSKNHIQQKIQHNPTQYNTTFVSTKAHDKQLQLN